MKLERQYSLRDQLCLSFDQLLRVLSNQPHTTDRAYPGGREKEVTLSPAEMKQAAALMRINHAGEVCAQALYHGQALASRHSSTTEKLQQAAIEEGDHLAWCSRRLTELDSHTSYLNPLWYCGAFCIGLAAGFMGDRWSLGFVAETENQVVTHLQRHLQQLPKKDEKSIRILKQMQSDEETHRQEAIHLGAMTLPGFIRKAMHWASKVMVKTAYWL